MLGCFLFLPRKEKRQSASLQITVVKIECVLFCGSGGIRTPGTVNPYVSLANWWFQPLTHTSKNAAKLQFFSLTAKFLWDFRAFIFFKIFQNKTIGTNISKYLKNQTAYNLVIYKYLIYYQNLNSYNPLELCQPLF